MTEHGWVEVCPWVEHVGLFGPVARCKVMLLLPDRVLWEYIALPKEEVEAQFANGGATGLQDALQARYDFAVTVLRTKAGVPLC